MQYIDKNGRLKIGETVTISGCIFVIDENGDINYGRRLYKNTPVCTYKAVDKTHKSYSNTPGKPATIRADIRSGAWRIA